MTHQITCTRCNGTGTIRGFSHISGGKCFACSGAGTRLVSRLSATERQIHDMNAAYAAQQARAASTEQMIALGKIGKRLRQNENWLVCTATGIPTNHCADFSADAVQAAIDKFSGELRAA
jgi:hypothetical protein